MDVPTVFALLIWVHFLNLLRTEVEQKRLSVKITYPSGNIVGLVMKAVVTSWTAPLFRVRTEELSKYLLQYIWYNTATGMYEHLLPQDLFAPFMQSEALSPSIRTIRCGGADVDEAAARCDAQQEHVMRLLA